MRVITATAGPGRYFSPIITHDGKLAAKSKPKIDPLFLTLAHRAVQSFANRLDHIERHVAHRNNLVEQGLSPVIIVANAAAKAAQLSAELYRDKIDNVVAEHREKKIEQAHRAMYGDPHDPREPRQSDPPAHPMGDGAFVTVEEAKRMFAERDAKKRAEQRAFEH
jgi:hypothetical protein